MNPESNPPNDGVVCGCGRSPTGKCIGWHNLTEEEVKQRMATINSRLPDPNTPVDKLFEDK